MAGTDDGGAVRGRGRPRDPAIEEAILDAAVTRLALDGYARMSIEAVARDAGVTKPTLYRRYPTKADLAVAALARVAAAEPVVDTGSTRDDLVGMLRAFRRSLTSTRSLALLGTVLSEEAHTPELAALWRDRLLRPRRAGLRAALARGVARGEVRADADLDVAVNLLVGSFYARHLTGDGIPADWPRRVVDAVWVGLEAHGR
jgi:AcrR family transcriptional regulator